MHGRCVSSRVVRLSELLSGLSRLYYHNALTEKTWEDATHGIGK